jgi:hypothetical protein
MTTTLGATSARPTSVYTYAEPVSLSQVLLDIVNGPALKGVDRDINRLKSKLNHPSMTSDRRAAQLRHEIRLLQRERNCIALTVSAHLS